jgi:hypothetical protein
VENRGADPFEVEVGEILETLRKYLPNWRALDDFVLDSETLKQIAEIVRLQGDWIKRRSTSLFIDPLLIEVKLKFMNSQQLIDVFQRSWHPAVEMEMLSDLKVEQAIDYWNQLASRDERLLSLPESQGGLGSLTYEELAKRNILSEASFREVLESLWSELKDMSQKEGKIEYWDFIRQKTYENTVKRAYLVSFLITYGYATLRINPLEGEVFLIPNSEIVEPSFGKQALTIPISVDRNAWKEKANEQ